MRGLDSSGFRVWSREDVRSALAALDQANCEVATMIDSYEMRLYRQGYIAALRSLAQMFGIDYAPKPCVSKTPDFHSIEAKVLHTSQQ